MDFKRSFGWLAAGLATLAGMIALRVVQTR